MTITDLDGKELRLSATRITEVVASSMNRWHATFENIRAAAKATKNGRVLDRALVINATSEYDGDKLECNVLFGKSIEGVYYFGCCRFDVQTFNKILRAAGVKIGRKNV